MTAVDTAEAPAEVIPTTDADPAPAGAKPRLTREAALAELEAAFTAWTDQMLLARRLTMGTDNVKSQSLCKTGVEAFLAKGHLQPTHHDRHHPATESSAQAAEAEAHIRTWVRGKLEGALEDYTATGLVKQAGKIRTAHEKWHKDFRELILVKYRESYIHLNRMQEVLPQLNMEPYDPRIYASIALNLDFHLPSTGIDGADMGQKRAALVERIKAAFTEIMGADASQRDCNYTFERHLRVSVDNWHGGS